MAHAVDVISDWGKRIDDAWLETLYEHTHALRCYGETVSGEHCQLPAGHYPTTLHYIGFRGGGFICWNDDQMDFFRHQVLTKGSK